MAFLGYARRTRRACENYVKDILYHSPRDTRKRRGMFLFRVLSVFFWIAVRTREILYKNRWFREQHLGCRVIVVGNLTVGGTGKTPIVEKLARALQGKGRKVGILSRGYKSKKEPWWKKGWHWLMHAEACPPKVVSDGVHCLLPYEQAGDEPLLLARNLPGVCVVVDKDRVKAGRYAIEKFSCDLLLLDDGFQYFQLKSSLYILLIDAMHPFGNGYVLPSGILREPVNRMKRAQFIFLTKSNQVSESRLQSLQRWIRRYNPHAPIFSCVHMPKGLCSVQGTDRLALLALKGRKVAALSGIASPQSFERFLEEQGATLVYRERFLDHHAYVPEERAEFFANAQRAGAEMVITTEKDAVRMPEAETFRLPFYFLRMEIEWAGDSEPFEAIWEKLMNFSV